MSNDGLTDDVPIWRPSPERIAIAEITAFIARLMREGAPALPGYAELYEYSVTEPERFWRAIWDHFEVKGEQGAVVARDLHRMPGVRHGFPRRGSTSPRI